jgi:hypothetical protein
MAGRPRDVFDVAVTIDHMVGNFQGVEHGWRDAALFDVLRFVFDAGLTAPADYQQQGNAVHLRVGQ